MLARECFATQADLVAQALQARAALCRLEVRTGRKLGQHPFYTRLMRLTKSEVLAIDAAAKAVLPRGARVLLFGSRTDDARRGGDIDLLVEPPTPMDTSLAADLSTRLAARLYRLIGERRIDIVVAAASEADERLIVREARRHAIDLART